MKQFRFSLESVRHWRESLLRQEEVRFQLLAAQRYDLAHRLEQLQQSEASQRRLIAHGASTTGSELQRLGEFTAYAGKICRRIESEISRLLHEMETQRGQVAKARQALELLERLKEKEHQLWRTANHRR
jgi:flagellar biosynthesis chaperone FliJ